MDNLKISVLCFCSLFFFMFGGCGSSSGGGDGGGSSSPFGYWYYFDEGVGASLVMHLNETGRYRLVHSFGYFSTGVFSFRDDLISMAAVANNFPDESNFSKDKEDVPVMVKGSTMYFGDLPDLVWERVNAEPEAFTVFKVNGWEGAYKSGDTLVRTVSVDNVYWQGELLPCLEEVLGGTCAEPQYSIYVWFDDGSNGDEVAGDGIYTNSFPVSNSISCTISGRISFISPSTYVSEPLVYEYSFGM